MRNETRARVLTHNIRKLLGNSVPLFATANDLSMFALHRDRKHEARPLDTTRLSDRDLQKSQVACVDERPRSLTNMSMEKS
jgi:hypothetical protein